MTITPENVENWVECDDGVHQIQMSEQLSHFGWVFRKVPGGLPYSVRLATTSEFQAAKNKQLIDQLVCRTSFNKIFGGSPLS